MYVDVRWNEFLFLQVFSRGPISRSQRKKIRCLGGTAIPTRKSSLGKNIPSVGMLIGLLLASTWRAASALLKPSSSTLSSWCGLYRRPDWAPHRLCAHALASWACSWSLQGHELNSAASGTSGSLKRTFLSLMIGVQWYAGLSLVVLWRLTRSRTKSANLLPEFSRKLGSLSAFLSWKQSALGLSSFLLSLCSRIGYEFIMPWAARRTRRRTNKCSVVCKRKLKVK